ncbi:hypothetical protein AVEN_100919-1 [Araneus ventricosus]|uniref:Histone-lysine N-methyltransferase SETMAR n=1 Tax=Araneus ventricosus TaxID=182803 RepID=A0A4Y2AXT9_ARAVE|nr:hypothetical protein AVEN_100919-1 [Araneus ventricosus]
MSAEGTHADCKNGNKLRGLLFLDDNARRHSARETKEHIRRLKRGKIVSPGLQPDLAPSDFHLSPALKSALSGCHFRRNEEVRQSVKNFLLSIFTRMAHLN